MTSRDSSQGAVPRLALVHKLATVHDGYTQGSGRVVYIDINPCISTAPTQEFHEVLSMLSRMIDPARTDPLAEMPIWIFDIRRVLQINPLTIAGVAMSLSHATRSAMYACMSQIIVVCRTTLHSDIIAGVITPIFHKPFRSITGQMPPNFERMFPPAPVMSVAVEV